MSPGAWKVERFPTASRAGVRGAWGPRIGRPGYAVLERESRHRLFSARHSVSEMTATAAVRGFGVD